MRFVFGAVGNESLSFKWKVVEWRWSQKHLAQLGYLQVLGGIQRRKDVENMKKHVFLLRTREAVKELQDEEGPGECVTRRDSIISQVHVIGMVGSFQFFEHEEPHA